MIKRRLFQVNLGLSSYFYLKIGFDENMYVFLVDTGASISVLKVNCLPTSFSIDESNIISISGITDEEVSTSGTAQVCVRARNSAYEHEFHIVNENFPVPVDGIIGLDFLTKFSARLDFDNWVAYMTDVNGKQHELRLFNQPSDDELIMPARCEAVRTFKTKTKDKYIYVPEQQLDEFIFIGETITSSTDPKIAVINIGDQCRRIRQDKIRYESLYNYDVFETEYDYQEVKERTERIMSKLRKNFPRQFKHQLEKLCREYIDVFGTSDDTVTVNNFYEQRIRLTDDSPVYIKNYRTPYSDKAEIDRQVEKMINDDILEPSFSEYNNPILLVPKKPLPGTTEKRWRLVTDFRQLNKRMTSDKYPLPRIDEILDKMGNAKYFTVLDLLSGFHQVGLEENSRDCTTITTDKGSFRYKRLPYGVKIAPNSFQRMMSLAFAGLSPERNFIYIDDYCLTATNEEEMLQNLKKVFERCRDVNLVLNAEKCSFFRTEVTYLGHKCTDKGILPDDAKYDVIKNYPVPRNADDVRRFVAFCNYYRKFVKNFAHHAFHLTRLTRKGITFVWTQDCQDAFEYLKKSLMEPSILQYPDFNKEFVLFTDASGFACGAVLTQKHNDVYLPVAYASKAFNHAERKKPIIELELLAIHWGIKHFRQYLYGQKFLVKSDHKPLIYLFNMVNPTSKLTRIRLDLTDFDFDVEYIKGSENTSADALSRISVGEFQNICRITYAKVYRVTTRKQAKKQQAVNQQQAENLNIELKKLRVYDCTRIDKVPHMSLQSDELIIVQNYRRKKKDENVTRKFPIKIQISKFFIRDKLQVHALLSELDRVGENLFDIVSIDRSDDLFNHTKIDDFKHVGNEKLKNIKIAITPHRIEVNNQEEQKNIIQKYHETALRGGHSGVRRTIEKIKTFYKWKNMSKQIHDYVRKCQQCQLNKLGLTNKQQLCKTKTPLKAFEVVQVDLQGPFLRSLEGNQYIVTIVCELTKYLIAIPIENKESRTVANAIFKHFIAIYGPMKTLVTDRGSEFKNEIIEKFNEMLGIQHNFSTPYHHRTLGTVERNHRTFNEYLRTYLNTDRTDWDAFLSPFVYCYNTTPSTATGYAPYEMIFGKNPPNFDFLDGSIDPVYNYDDYVSELRYRLQTEYKRVCEQIEKDKIARKNAYDKNVREVSFQIGDLILIRKESNHKHENLFIGPFEIESLDEFNVTVKDDTKRMTVHKDRIKRYRI